MSEARTTNLDIAMERILGFAQKFDQAHFDLACHAAFPQTLTPDLLYQIWLRFVPQAPWTAVARILLSRLCREVGYELYEMDVAVRNLLLTELKEDERFGKQQLDKLAEFYTDYLKQQFAREEGQEEDLTQPQYWIGLASTKSKHLNRELAKAIESRLQQKNWKELFRLASFIEAVPEALVEFEAPLITYVRGMLSYTTGDLEGAAEEFSKLPRRERQVEIVGVNLSIPDEVPLVEVELAFLQRLLQIISESKGDAQVVYPFLAANSEKLNLHLAEVLRLWATNILTKAQSDAAQLLATDVSNFSHLISQFPLGNKAINIEIAITGYEIVLTVFTREESPRNWAGIQALLGNAYRDRIKGNRAENLEQAIAYFLAALQIFTRDHFPQDWALMQISLAEAYINRIRGDKTENLEQAIASCLDALQVLTLTDFPLDWAGTQINLGIAYINRIKGDKAENIEYAIAAFTQALEVRTRIDFPVEWAATQNALGTAYINRIKGDKAENIEYAIAAFTQALEVRTRHDFPIDWANAQNNLGNAYRDRIRGDKAENLEMAIYSCQNALQVYTREAFPINWAVTMNNLGFAYRDRIVGDHSENLEQAISCFDAAFQVYSLHDFPVDWANTQNNLGIAYRDRIRGERADNIKRAINCFENALQVYTRISFPQQWAENQKNLGTTYSELIGGDRTNNIERAINCFQNALQVYTSTSFPQKHLETLFNLAIAYQDNSQLNSSYDAFANIIDSLESFQGSTFNRWEVKGKKQDLTEILTQACQSMVEVCLKLGYIDKAIEYVERSKVRNLVKLIANCNLHPKGNIPDSILNELQRLRLEISTKQLQLESLNKNISTLVNIRAEDGVSNRDSY
ncbi:tetratricopeptide repeat protein [Okeanomitos corallinicola TIOX110]|uniref:Tetratricopeptide repeat protein n=1 Tax=Okeanomitos corallinicola TIOX110 TaxID=3133117 RepID=A0ABZ2UWI2_9CYAN